MGKYVIESKFENTRCFLEVACENREPYFFINRVDSLTPYAEPDLEQVRKEAYEQGLSDAKEGKATCQYCEYVYIDETEEPCKKCCNAYMNKYKPKAKEEQIQVGDEVKNTQTDARFIVTHMWVNNHGEKGVSGFNYECSAFSTALDLVRKTGRHFPEIAEVFAKMKESDNG